MHLKSNQHEGFEGILPHRAPLCTRAVCVLAHYFEKHDIASIAISLIRLTAEKIAPPRSLWVPFDLGRPFGKPNDSKTQRDVVEQALSLLNSGDVPVLEDFPDQFAEKTRFS